jgi:signal transduction histidine kinase
MSNTLDDTTQAGRIQTNESLRVERAEVDRAILDNLAEIDVTADAAINRTRARADALLAATRAATDRQLERLGAPARAGEAIRIERTREDQTRTAERREADQEIRDVRADAVERLVTERGETDADLNKERALSDNILATRDVVMALVIHDLHNMLSTITGFAAMIEEDANATAGLDSIRASAHWIQVAGSRMHRLVGDMGDVASIEAGVFAFSCEDGDPVDVIHEAVKTFEAQAAAAGIRLSMTANSPSRRISFDSGRIFQVLTNLLSNAIKFTPRGGTIVVECVNREGDCQISVRDTGSGIASDKLDEIFKRFVQLRTNDRRGVGLGLYISRCIVQGHGGRIWAESEPGEGSTFRFTLPARHP